MVVLIIWAVPAPRASPPYRARPTIHRGPRVPCCTRERVPHKGSTLPSRGVGRARGRTGKKRWRPQELLLQPSWQRHFFMKESSIIFVEREWWRPQKHKAAGGVPQWKIRKQEMTNWQLLQMSYIYIWTVSLSLFSFARTMLLSIVCSKLNKWLNKDWLDGVGEWNI